MFHCSPRASNLLCGGCGVKMVEPGNRFDTLVIIFQVEFFVGGMQVVIIKTESHENNLYAEFVFENGTDWDASPATNGDRRFTKCFFNGLCRRLVSFAFYRRAIWLTTVMFKGLY